MSDIEENIMSEEAFNELIDNFEVVETLTDYGRKAIKQNVKKLKTRIQELEEENSDLKIENNFRIVGHYAEVKLEEILKEDYIPKQKVKDEIEALRKMLKATMEGKLQEYTPGEIIIKINTLEELLEDK